MQVTPIHPSLSLELKAKLELESINNTNKIIKIIVDKVSEMTHAPEDWLINRSRFKEYVEPRKILMYVLLERMKCSQAELSSHFNWDRTTFIAARKSVKNIMSYDSSYENYVLTICEEVDKELMLSDSKALERVLNRKSNEVIRMRAKRKMVVIRKITDGIIKDICDWDMQGYQKHTLVKRVNEIKEILEK